MKLNSANINAWESNNKSVDIYKIADEETMLTYKSLANDKGLNTYIVVDAGRTQVVPNTKTVMAIGPASNEQLDWLTKTCQAYI